MTGRRQVEAITGKVNPMIPTLDAEPQPTRSAAENRNHRMTTVDGVPCPAYVGGTKVVKARLASPPEGKESSPNDQGRTLLLLATGHKLNGCVDCVFTHSHWSAISGHRQAAHGAARAVRRRRTAGNGQLELTSAGIAATVEADEPENNLADADELDSEEPGQDLARVVHTGELVEEQPVPAAPARERSGVRMPPAAAGGVLSMTLSEVLDLASDLYNNGADREHLLEEIARLRKENVELRRALRKVDTILNRVHDVTAVTKSKNKES